MRILSMCYIKIAPMKIAIILIPIIFLTSCSINRQDEKDAKIRELEQLVEQQKTEIEKLNDEMILLKSWIGSKNFSDGLGMQSNVATPEDMTFKETSSKDCIEKARKEYMDAGNKQCEQMGFTKADMAARKCKLTKEFIDVIQKKLQDDELACGPGQ